MSHPSMKTEEERNPEPLIRRGVAEAVILACSLGVVFGYGTLHGERMMEIPAAIAFGGATLLLALEIFTWIQGDRVTPTKQE